jgi:hypothetical protein
MDLAFLAQVCFGAKCNDVAKVRKEFAKRSGLLCLFIRIYTLYIRMTSFAYLSVCFGSGTLCLYLSVCI